MGIKLVAIDIDGTLINDERKVTAEVRQAIQEAKAVGVKIVITTGRPIQGVEPLLKELNLKEHGDYVITYNGGLVQETDTYQELVRYVMERDDFLKLEPLSRKLNVHCHTLTNDAIYTCNRNIGYYSMWESMLVNLPLRYRTPEEITSDPDFEYIKMMYIDEPELLDQAIAQLPAGLADQYNLVRSSPYYFELLNKKVSKGVAMLSLAEKLGIKPEETMAIGDAENDLSMLQVAGMAVAMGNATEEVKKVAHVVTTTNNEHGVAVALRKWVLDPLK